MNSPPYPGDIRKFGVFLFLETNPAHCHLQQKKIQTPFRWNVKKCPPLSTKTLSPNYCQNWVFSHMGSKKRIKWGWYGDLMTREWADPPPPDKSADWLGWHYTTQLILWDKKQTNKKQKSVTFLSRTCFFPPLWNWKCKKWGLTWKRCNSGCGSGFWMSNATCHTIRCKTIYHAEWMSSKKIKQLKKLHSVETGVGGLKI